MIKRKLFAGIFAILLSLVILTSAIAETPITIGYGSEWEDPNFSFNEVPQDINYGTKINDNGFNWEEGMYFVVPDGAFTVFTRNKQKKEIACGDLVYIVIKAGSEKSGGGNWTFFIDEDNEVFTISTPPDREDDYLILVSEYGIMVIQLEYSKDVSNVSFFFEECVPVISPTPAPTISPTPTVEPTPTITVEPTPTVSPTPFEEETQPGDPFTLLIPILAILSTAVAMKKVRKIK